jgi:hypothetical protein
VVDLLEEYYLLHLKYLKILHQHHLQNLQYFQLLMDYLLEY